MPRKWLFGSARSAERSTPGFSFPIQTKCQSDRAFAACSTKSYSMQLCSAPTKPNSGCGMSFRSSGTGCGFAASAKRSKFAPFGMKRVFGCAVRSRSASASAVANVMSVFPASSSSIASTSAGSISPP